ncbi:DUF6153 family protein [Streptomyces sp. FXJ1.172]|uniref:DUF6153 family protein n=1 Tax=Streptomyces sp. FXJ1.172 TaxID=710705 RepID=UPI00082D28E0|nr:DUF6153 family protein [Streptomyces sp. FXJ1.172]WEO98811.1 DUF6153 family protein [Streptomyces sp. FXJ1.172]
MISTGRHAPHPPPWRRCVLLVLALFVGLLGVHALGSGGAPGRTEHARAAHPLALTAQDGCPGGDRHRGGGRRQHADAACASGVVTGGLQLPALLPDPVAANAPDTCPRSRAATGLDGARAPPSPAGLHVLRT